MPRCFLLPHTLAGTIAFALRVILETVFDPSSPNTEPLAHGTSACRTFCLGGWVQGCMRRRCCTARCWWFWPSPFPGCGVPPSGRLPRSAIRVAWEHPGSSCWARRSITLGVCSSGGSSSMPTRRMSSTSAAASPPAAACWHWWWPLAWRSGVRARLGRSPPTARRAGPRRKRSARLGLLGQPGCSSASSRNSTCATKARSMY
ncbi:hypothetical protein D3C84_352760 [compost metagenome]